MADPLRAVIFDLDGTIIDTAPDLHAYLADMLTELGHPVPRLEEVRPMIGDGARMLLRRGLEATGGAPAEVELDRLYADFLDRYTRAPLRFGTTFEGLVELLEGLRRAGLKIGLCTNKPDAPTRRLLEELDLAHLFDAVVGGDVLPVRKPDPGHLEAVLERLGVAAGEALLVGDSRNDVEAARAAGVPVVVVSFGYTQVPAADLGADLVIDRLSDLPAACRRLEAFRKRRRRA